MIIGVLMQNIQYFASMPFEEKPTLKCLPWVASLTASYGWTTLVINSLTRWYMIYHKLLSDLTDVVERSLTYLM